MVSRYHSLFLLQSTMHISKLILIEFGCFIGWVILVKNIILSSGCETAQRLSNFEQNIVPQPIGITLPSSLATKTAVSVNLLHINIALPKLQAFFFFDGRGGGGVGYSRI